MADKSIYEYMKSVVEAAGGIDACPEDGFKFELPPEDSGMGDLIFADGAWDGICIYHGAGEPVTEETRTRLKTMFYTLAHKSGETSSADRITDEARTSTSDGSGQNVIKGPYDPEMAKNMLDDILQRNRAIMLMDTLVEIIAKSLDELDGHALFEFAIELACQSKSREHVKIGMGMLELLPNPHESVKEVIRILSLSDEFTLFGVIAMNNWENANDEIFAAARRVHEWGRVHAIRYLKPETDEIKDWLLKEGVKNYPGLLYTALDCYRKAGVYERLKGEPSDEELLSIARIIDTLLDEDAMPGISAIDWDDEPYENGGASGEDKTYEEASETGANADEHETSEEEGESKDDAHEAEYSEAADMLCMFLDFVRDRDADLSIYSTVLNIYEYTKEALLYNSAFFEPFRRSSLVKVSVKCYTRIRDAINVGEEIRPLLRIAADIKVKYKDELIKRLISDFKGYARYIEYLSDEEPYMDAVLGIFRENIPVESLLTRESEPTEAHISSRDSEPTEAHISNRDSDVTGSQDIRVESEPTEAHISSRDSEPTEAQGIRVDFDVTGSHDVRVDSEPTEAHISNRDSDVTGPHDIRVDSDVTGSQDDGANSIGGKNGEEKKHEPDEFGDYLDVVFLLQELRKWPMKGTDYVENALDSVVQRNRNSARQLLKEWVIASGKPLAELSSELWLAVEKVHKKEDDESTLAELDALLRGEVAFNDGEGINEDENDGEGINEDEADEVAEQGDEERFRMDFTFETERLGFRPWTIEDTEACFALSSDEHVGPPCGWQPHKTVDETRQILKDILINDHTYAIIEKATGTIVGNMGIDLPHPETKEIIAEKEGGMSGSDDKSKSEHGEGYDVCGNERELGFWMGYPYWNKGYMTEAVKGTIRYCFDVLGCERIWCGYFADNPASGRVQEKCGFTHYATRTFYLDGLQKEVLLKVNVLERSGLG